VLAVLLVAALGPAACGDDEKEEGGAAKPGATAQDTPTKEQVIEAAMKQPALKNCAEFGSIVQDDTPDLPSDPRQHIAIICGREGGILAFYDRYSDEATRARTDSQFSSSPYLANGNVRVNIPEIVGAGIPKGVNVGEGAEGKRNAKALLEAIRQECGCGGVENV
jgi:hypothetical protein